MQTVTAIEMAEADGVNPKLFRKELRKQQFPWHIPTHRWTVPKDSPEYSDMLKVLESLKDNSA
jgi:hypothetical protein